MTPLESRSSFSWQSSIISGPHSTVKWQQICCVGRQAHHDSVGDEDAESGLSSERRALAGSVASGDEADGHRGIRVGEAAHPGQLVD